MAQPGCMSVYSGKFVNLFNFEPKDIRIEDIATALSNLCRFGGHTREFYSVAQHSVRVAASLPPHLRLDGLLHDAAEAYVVDLPRPLKMVLPEYKAIEDEVQSTIAFRFGLTDGMHPLVKAADESALCAEFKELMNFVPPSEWFAGVDPLPTVTKFWTPAEAKGAFLIMFAESVSEKLLTKISNAGIN